MFVKKAHTRAFHLPADEVGVLRRSNATGVISGGGFERAWNEVSKLQANIDSGYYTHSSGESDLPPSDDDYSDEMYLGPRRKTLIQNQRSHRADSPRSSLTSGNTKANKRRRHTSSSSHQTTTSDTPTGGSPARDASPCTHGGKHFRTHGLLLNSHTDPTDKRLASNRLPMPVVQPGTPGAAAISALAETKAAMAAAVGSGRRPAGSFTADLLSLTRRNHDKPYRKQSKENHPNVPIRGQRGRGRPPLRDSKGRPIRRRKYRSSSSSPHSSDSPSSSVSSGSLSEVDVPRTANNGSQNNWCSNSSTDWKVNKTEMPRRGRPPKSRGRVKAVNDVARSSWCSPRAESSDAEGNSELWTKLGSSSVIKPSPSRGRPKLAASNNSLNRIEDAKRKRLTIPSKNPIQDTENSGSKRSKRYSKQMDSFGNVRDEDDELTDRCDSPIGNDSQNLRHSNNYRWHSHHSSSVYNASGTPVSSVRKSGINDSSIHKTSPSKKASTAKQRSSHSSNYSTCSSPSSSDMDDNDESGRRHRNIVKVDDEDDDRRFRSPTRSGSSNKDRTSGASSTMLRRPPFAPPLNTSGSISNSITANDRNSLSTATNLFSHTGQNLFSPCNDSVVTMNSSVNSGTSSTNNRLSGSIHPTTSNANLSSHFISSGALSSNSNNVVTTPGMSTLPRSHLPPNKRAAAAATAAALNRDSVGGGGNDVSNETNQRQASVKSPEISVTSSPRKQLHKGIQTPASMEMPTSSQQPCSQCKEREAERLIAANDTKRALRELEEKLIAQFKEEKAAALHSALEQAQASAREAIEHERKLAHDTLEAAEARFAEVIVQTKRRQWCRNCLMEAIYHCCWNTSYCSTQCQQEHWQKEHKRQCRRKR
ncbi:unnamed protein product [Schistosoma rodhaini]|nr:unnamed protein product [Schistosoma rodhaini]